MSVALKAVAWAWRFTQTENDSPVLKTPGIYDSPVSYVPESCESPVSYTPGSHKFDPLKIQNCPKYWGVKTPWCPKHRRVVLMFVWTFKPMLLPLKQHSFKKLSKSNVSYANTFDLCLKVFLAQELRFVSLVLRTPGSCFKNPNNSVKNH